MKRSTQLLLIPTLLSILLYLIAQNIIRSIDSTATSTALFRHLSTFDPDPNVTGGDHLAQLFLPTTLQYLSSFALTRWILTQYVSRSTPGTAEAIHARTLYLDIHTQLSIHTHRNLRQVVILGAGYDTRCVRYANFMSSREVPITCYEVDLPSIQQHKQAVYNASGLDTTHIHFVASDLNAAHVQSALESAGWKQHYKSLFVMEGVSAYLDRTSVHALLSFFAKHTLEHSMFYFTYLTNDKGCHGEAQVKRLVSGKGEPYKYLVNEKEQEMEKLLEQNGLELREKLDDNVLSQYLSRSDGTPGPSVLCLLRVVHAVNTNENASFQAALEADEKAEMEAAMEKEKQLYEEFKAKEAAKAQTQNESA